jgi:DNA replication protein DnaC
MQNVAAEISGQKSFLSQTVRFLDSEPGLSTPLLIATLKRYGLADDATVAEVEAARGRETECILAKRKERHECALRDERARNEAAERQWLQAQQQKYGLPPTATREDIFKARDAAIDLQQAEEAAQAKAHKIQNLWDCAAIPGRHREKVGIFTGPPEWIAKRDVAWRVVLSGGLVALVGTRGNGKTQMAVELIRRSCETRRSANYIKAMDFFIELRTTFKPDGGDESKVLDRLTDYRLLVVDNVDRRGSSEWEDRCLTHLIDKRYDRCAGTILIANLDEAAFTEHMGPDIVDRIRDGGGLIVADWPSFRGATP